MISVDEALARVLEAATAAGRLEAEPVALAEATGRVLREEVLSEQGMPPFTRSAMDGFALRAADTRRTPAGLEVIEEIPAGRAPAKVVGPGQASRIMTGAALPPGADAVQMIEKTRPASLGGTVEILESVQAGEHVRQAGEDLARGARLMAEGDLIGPAAIGLLASAGRAQVRVSRRPRVTIIPTGDELVPPDQQPGATQIRESNGHTLQTLVRAAGGLPDLRPIAPDDATQLREVIVAGLESCEILLMSGGVSMGDYDFVGEALVACGCRKVFDRVAIQPGKPLFFATRAGEGAKLIFGLPGNPVSTVVDFLLFARPAMRRLMGATQCEEPRLAGRLDKDLSRRPGRRAFLPVTLRSDASGVTATLLPSMGSADMVSLARAEALAIIPEEASDLPAGSSVQLLPLSGLTRT